MDSNTHITGEVFRINEYITLKLENRQTKIYVGGEEFIRCKYLLLNIPIANVREYDNIRSIDETAEHLHHGLERNTSWKKKITPEMEFWGHCSNLQAWVENNYNTALLHRNLAFPLLKKLTESGDPKARKVFKEEIAKRFSNGRFSVMCYLISGGYLSYLSEEEFETITYEKHDPQFWMNMGRCYSKNQEYKKAIKALKMAIRYDYRNYRYWNELGTYFMHLNKYLEAKRALDIALRHNSEYTDALINLGTVLIKLGKNLKVINLLEGYLIKNPQELVLYPLLIKGYEREKNYHQCVEIIQKVIKFKPNDFKWWRRLAEIYLKQGQYKSVIRIFKRIYRRQHDSIHLKKSYVSNLREPQQSHRRDYKINLIVLFLTLCCLIIGDIERAQFFYKSNPSAFSSLNNFHIDLELDKHIITNKIGDVYYLIGNIYQYKIKNIEKAVYYFKEAYKANQRYFYKLYRISNRYPFLKVEKVLDLDNYDPYYREDESEILENEKKDYTYDYLVKDSKTRRRSIQKIKEKRKRNKY